MVVANGFPDSVTLYSSNANDFVHHMSTECFRRICILKGFIFGGAKLGNAGSVECANGKPLEHKQRWNPNCVPVPISGMIPKVFFNIWQTSQEHIPEFA